MAKNTVYAGYARIGTYYAINYDRVFSQGTTFSKSFNAGISLLKTDIAFPIGINFFTGHQQHHAEFSLSVVPYIERYNYLFKPGNLSDKKLYILPAAGYRYQKPGGGFFGKIQAGPVFYFDPASDSNTKTDSRVYPGIIVGIGGNF
ncbi:MAG: hypothetical protein WAT19_10820 [Ferruginibacter sp.]